MRKAFGSNYHVVDALERDAQGKPTGVVRVKPVYIIMLSWADYHGHELDGINPLAQFLFDPAHIDNCYAGSGNYDPRDTTAYLKFVNEAEANARGFKVRADPQE